MNRAPDANTTVRALPQLIDTHTHLDEPAFDVDRDEVVARALTAGVSRLVNIAYCPGRWASTRRVQKTYPLIAVAAGLHPNQVGEFNAGTIDDLRAFLEQSRAVAVGEIGFDFYRPGYDATLQERVFRAQLALAAEMDLPVVIHQRSAEAASMEVLTTAPSSVQIVLHSFDATWDLGRLGMERGYYFGVGGLMTRASSETVRAILAEVPAERLLLETDAPYLPPSGSKPRRNEPANIPLIARRLADLRGTSTEEIARQTTENARRVFGLDAPTGNSPVSSIEV